LLGSWHQQFGFFLKALDGPGCPLCAVTAGVAGARLAEMVRQPAQATRLCGAHLSALLGMTRETAVQVSAAQSALSNCMGRDGGFNLGCEICRLIEQAAGRLATIIRLLDKFLRFEKAIQRAPLFCCSHIARITAGGCARNFARIQRGKLEELINEIAQAELLGRPALYALIEKTATFLGAPFPIGQAAPEADSCDAEAGAPESAALAEFARWEEEQKNAHLGRLESETASLRYRNAVLSEENRRFRLAHAAVEALRRDLERERAQVRAAGLKPGRAVSNHE